MRHLFTCFLFLFFSCNSEDIPSDNEEVKYRISTHLVSEIQENLQVENQFRDDVALLIDLSISSNKNRLFVYDVDKDSITHRGLVTHGSCNGTTAPNLAKYSNIESSYCSSLGKYKIGNAYTGKFGLAFKLHGLDETNDKAFERFIVLHAHECVPDLPVNYLICESQGCPTVSTLFLDTLHSIIRKRSEPTLLWIVDDEN